MLGGGLLPLLLEHRAKAGREDPVRLDERKASTWHRDRGKSRLGTCGIRWRNALGLALAV